MTKYNIFHKKKQPAFFLHIPKTGGSYTSQNYKSNQSPIWPIEMHGHCYFVHAPNIINYLYYPHMKDWYYRTTVNIEEINNKFIFSIVRNNFNWLVSYLDHAAGWTPNYKNTEHYDYEIANKGFDYLVNTIANREYPWPSRKFIFFQLFASNGDFVVDWINRKEALDDDLAQMAKYAGLKYKARGKKRVGSHKDYREYYNDSIIELVNRTWGREQKIFGYDFDGHDKNKAILHHKINSHTKSLLKYNLEENSLWFNNMRLTND